MMLKKASKPPIAHPAKRSHPLRRVAPALSKAMMQQVINAVWMPGQSRPE